MKNEKKLFIVALLMFVLAAASGVLLRATVIHAAEVTTEGTSSGFTEETATLLDALATESDAFTIHPMDQQNDTNKILLFILVLFTAIICHFLFRRMFRNILGGRKNE